MGAVASRSVVWRSVISKWAVSAPLLAGLAVSGLALAGLALAACGGEHGDGTLTPLVDGGGVIATDGGSPLVDGGAAVNRDGGAPPEEDAAMPLPPFESQSLGAGFYRGVVGIDSMDRAHVLAEGIGDLHWFVPEGDGFRHTELSRSDPRNLAAAFRSDARPVIAYYSWDLEDLYYEEWNGSDWDRRNLGRENTVHVSLAVDSSDQVFIAYYEADGRELLFGRPGETLEQVAGSGAGRPSLALDAAGAPEMVFNQQGGGMRHAQRSGDHWTITEIASNGGRSSFAIASDGSRHACWVVDDDPYDFPPTPDEVHYAHSTGGAWTVTTITTNAMHESGCSIAATNGNDVRLLYTEGLIGTIVLAHIDGATVERTNLEPDCIETTSGSAGVYERGLAIDSMGRSHAAYYCRYASYARSNVSGR